MQCNTFVILRFREFSSTCLLRPSSTPPYRKLVCLVVTRHTSSVLTYFNCLLKSSFSSSSSQLSSQRCVVPPGTSVSSCDQSVHTALAFPRVLKDSSPLPSRTFNRKVFKLIILLEHRG